MKIIALTRDGSLQRLVQLTSETGEAEELEETSSDAPCMHYNCTYVSVTPKLSNM